MNIQEKIAVLKSCLAKSEDLDYSIQVTWGENVEASKAELRTILNNAENLFVKGSINRLDLDVRNEAYAKWNNVLDGWLAKFPDTALTQDEPTQGPRL